MGQPTEKQIALAEKLSKEHGVPIPDGVLDDFDLTSDFITNMIEHSRNNPSPPSEKQIALAKKLSKERQAPLPSGFEKDWRICKDFIDLHIKSA